MKHTDTSAIAYRDIKPKAPPIREQVLNLVQAQNGVGISRTQIARTLGINEITAGSRLTELQKAGKVRRKGETVPSTSGKPEHLYTIGDGRVYSVRKDMMKFSAERMATVLNKLKVTSDRLYSAFIWDDTVDGHDFWADVYAKLSK